MKVQQLMDLLSKSKGKKHLIVNGYYIKNIYYYLVDNKECIVLNIDLNNAYTTDEYLLFVKSYVSTLFKTLKKENRNQLTTNYAYYKTNYVKHVLSKLRHFNKNLDVIGRSYSSIDNLECFFNLSIDINENKKTVSLREI